MSSDGWTDGKKKERRREKRKERIKEFRSTEFSDKVTTPNNQFPVDYDKR